MDFNVQCCLAVIILMGKLDLHPQSFYNICLRDSRPTVCSMDRDKRDKQISYTVLYNYTTIILVSFPDPSRRGLAICNTLPVSKRNFNQLLNHVLMFTHMVIIGGVCSYLHAVVLVCKPFFALLDHGAATVLCLACGDEALTHERRVLNGTNSLCSVRRHGNVLHVARPPSQFF